MALPKIFVEIDSDVRGAIAGIDQVDRKMGQLSKRAIATGSAIGSSRGSSNSFARGLQNASFQISDFATQVGAGTRASVALGQQLPQLLGGFGILGAVLGAVVAIAVPLTRAFNDMAKESEGLKNVFGTMQPVVDSIASAFLAVRDAGIDMAEVIINNLDQITAYALTAAAVFGTRLVVSFVAARIATITLAGSLVVLRGALIRTGIGALIVGAGELVYQFSRLVQAAGGFSQALALIGAIFTEVWDRMKRGISLMGELFDGLAMTIKGAFMTAFGFIAQKFIDLINLLIEKINAFRSLLKSIPGVGDLIEGGDTEKLGPSELFQGGKYVLGAGKEILDSVGISMSDLFNKPLKSVQAIRDVLASIKEDQIDLPSLFGAGTNADGGAGGGKAAPSKSMWAQTIENIERMRAAYEGLRQAQMGVWSSMGELLQQFAGKSRAAAIAVIAIQKGLSIAQIIANTAAAQMRALAELGPIAGPPVAARIAMMGRIQAGIVAATGLAQAMGGGRSAGGSASIGGVGGAVADRAGGSGQGTYVNVQLTGYATGEQTVRALIAEINRAIDNGAVIKGMRLV